MTETGEVQFGGTTIPFTIRRSKRRRKTIAIVLDPAKGVLVSAPMRTSHEEIRTIVHHRAGWIVRKTTEATARPRRTELGSGESVQFMGRQIRLLVEDAAVARVTLAFDGETLRITAPTHLSGEERRDAISSAVVSWYREQAAEVVTARVNVWATRMGVQPSRMLIRDQRQRWGSCAPDGTLRLNWRVVMAEPALIDYVVVHELLHLRIRNHAREFWDAMAHILPDFKQRRRSLRELSRELPL